MNYLSPTEKRPSKIPVKSVSSSLSNSHIPRPITSSKSTITTHHPSEKRITTRATITPRVHKRRTSSTSSNSSVQTGTNWLTSIFTSSSSSSSSLLSTKKKMKSIVRLCVEDDKQQDTLWRIEDQTIRYLGPRNIKKFEFDHVFRQNVSNTDLFESSCAKSLVQEFVNGYSGTLFTYGQPGTGKTYTMYGNKNDLGIVDATFNTIFDQIKMDNVYEYVLCLSCFEIINETIKDLFVEEAHTLKISDDNKRRGAYVAGLQEQVISSPLEAMQYIRKAEANRYLLSSNYDNHTSRAHTFIQLTLERRDKTLSKPNSSSNMSIISSTSSSTSSTARRTRTPKKRDTIQISHLYLIDLASNDKSIYQNLKNPINKSCLALEAIVHNLSEVGKSAGHPLPPYHDSKLTRLLQPTFQGQHYLVNICTVDLVSASQDEMPTLDTFNFAARIRKISVSPKLCDILEEKSVLIRYVNDISFLSNKLEKIKQEETTKDLSHITTILEERLYKKSRMILSSQSNFDELLNGEEGNPWGIIAKLRKDFDSLVEAKENQLQCVMEETKGLPEEIAQLEAELNITKAELQVTQLLINENKFI